MMVIRQFNRVIVALVFTLSISISNMSYAAMPSELQGKVSALVTLLGDSYSTGYPEATMVLPLQFSNNKTLVLVVFTIEGFAGGNSHSQFLAVFEFLNDDLDRPEYSFIDAIYVAGKGSGSIQTLEGTTATLNAKTNMISFILPAMLNTENDAPNFPSEKGSIEVFLQNNHLSITR